MLNNLAGVPWKEGLVRVFTVHRVTSGKIHFQFLFM